MISMLDVPFGNKMAWQDFLFEHYLEHKQIADAIFQKYGVQIATPVFTDESDINSWLLNNAEAHAQELQVIGLQGIVPTDVNLNDQQAYNDWMAIHAMIHQAERATLGF